MKLIRLTFLLIMILFTASYARSQNCDCNNTPYRPDPPCFSVCNVRLLANINVDQLVRIVRLREELARRIVSWGGRQDAQRFEDYSQILSPSEMQEVGSTLNSLSPRQIRELRGDRGDPFSRIQEQRTEQQGTDPIQRAVQQSQSEAKETAKENAITYAYYQDKKGDWRWRIVNGLGRVLAESTAAYKTEAACRDDIWRVRNATSANVKRTEP